MNKTVKPQDRQLTGKQLAFINAYLSNGFNATAAAREAGYKGNDNTLRNVGCENLTKPNIIKAIKAKRAEVEAKTEYVILSRLQRQALWSQIASNPEHNMADRLRASELLGRSEADFTDNLNQGDLQRQAVLTEAEQVEARAIAKLRLRGLAGPTMADSQKAEHNSQAEAIVEPEQCQRP